MNRINSPSFITDISGSFSEDLSSKSKVNWDFTRFDNEGEIPAYGAANKELHMCPDGLVWSRGGACYPFTRSLGLKSTIGSSFSLTHTGELSFVLWIKMTSAVEDASLFNTNSQKIELLIRQSDSKIVFKRSDLSVDLSLPFSTDSWSQVGGYYTTTGV